MGKILTRTNGWNKVTGMIGDIVENGNELDISNISLNAVANKLGIINKTITNVCTSNNINQWSYYKPWNRLDGVVDTGMKVSNGNLTYVKPTNVSGYYLGDFAGYNHDALPPEFKEPSINSSYYNSVYYDRNTGDRGFGTIIIRLPEIDFRLISSIDRIYIETIYPDDEDWNYSHITYFNNDRVNSRRIDVIFGYYQDTMNNNSFTLQAWLGNSSNNKLCNLPITNYFYLNQIDTISKKVYFNDTEQPVAVFNNADVAFNGTTKKYEIGITLYDLDNNNIAGSHYLRGRRITSTSWTDLGVHTFQFGLNNFSIELPESLGISYSYNPITEQWSATLTDSIILELNTSTTHHNN